MLNEMRVKKETREKIEEDKKLRFEK